MPARAAPAAPPAGHPGTAAGPRLEAALEAAAELRGLAGPARIAASDPQQPRPLSQDFERREEWQWIAADPHIHAAGCAPWVVEDPQLSSTEILAAMKKRGLSVGNVLVWHDTGGPSQGPLNTLSLYEWERLTGQDYQKLPHEATEYANQLLHYDLEVSGYQPAWLGHVTALGLGDIVSQGPCPGAVGTCNAPPESDYPSGCSCTVHELNKESGLPIAQWAYGTSQPRRPVLGVNHTNAWRLNHTWPWDNGPGLPPLPSLAPVELPVHIALGAWQPPPGQPGHPPISFMAVETAQPDPTGPLHQPTDVLTRAARQVWSDFQNSGFRIAIVGASDNRCIQRQIGQLRTLVLINGPVTFDNYLEGLLQGRTQAVLGQGTWAILEGWLTTTPNDQKQIGDTLSVPAGGQVSFSIQVQLKVAGMIELMSNGAVVSQCRTMGQVGLNDLTCENLVPTSSGWITVRAPRVQTSPIYMEYDGAAYVPDVGALCRNVANIDRLISEYAQPGGRLAAYLTQYQNARQVYLDRLPAGTNCNNPPPPPPPAACPGNDELNAIVPGQEYADYFPGFWLPSAPVKQRVTGTLTPHVGTAANPVHTYAQPFGGGNPLCTSPHPSHTMPGDKFENWSCPDVDHFVVPATCQAAGTYLRARAVVWTERLTRDRHAVEFCWSGLGEPRCSANTIGNGQTWFTEPGGGTTVDDGHDVLCRQAGFQYFLNVRVWNRDFPDGGVSNWTPEPYCDEYSLFYSVEEISDGYVPGFIGHPINP